MGIEPLRSKILFILHLPPPVHGAAMVGKYIHDSRVVNEAFECRYVNLAMARNLEDIGKVGLLRGIKKEVESFRPDLVYITPNAKGGAFYKEFVIVQMLKRMGCRVVANYHNKGVRMRQGRWLDDKLYRAFFKDIKVILLAESLYSDICKYVDRENVFICPNGIPEMLSSEPLIGRHNDVPHILFLSNLIVSKGVLVLLDALRMLKEHGYSFVCDFVGGETAEIDADRFQREAESRCLTGIAVYYGKRYGEEKETFFKCADMFAFPTYYDSECFPLVLLEAMQHGLPCISTNEGGIPDIVRKGVNGFLVDTKSGLVDAQELADAIATLLDDKELRCKMGKEGYRIFHEQFTLPQFERRITEILKDCL